jgi:hypothetical protein
VGGDRQRKMTDIMVGAEANQQSTIANQQPIDNHRLQIVNV